MRQTLRFGPMPALRRVIAGDDAVGEMSTTPLGIVTPVATAIVEVLDIVPMIALTLSTLTSLVASWTAGPVAVWSSRASTIWTEILVLRPRSSAPG